MSDNDIKVVSAAIKYKDEVYSIPQPARHHDVIRLIHEKTGDMNIHGEQGFMLSDGTFARRARAKMFAIKSNQLLPTASSLKELYSEDVW